MQPEPEQGQHSVIDAVGVDVLVHAAGLPGIVPQLRSAALATPEIKRLVAASSTRSLADLRNRTPLLLGYAGALLGGLESAA